MSFLTNWFRKRQPEDFEQTLTRLADDIQRRQTHLADIRLRERRVTLLVTLYSLGFWIAYASIWYANPGLLPAFTNQGRASKLEKALKGAPVVVGPIFILLSRRIVQLAYGRVGNSEEKHLVTLRKEQRTKIEEFKKKTKYYETRALVEKFDEANPTDSSLRRRTPAPTTTGTTPAGTPQRQPGSTPRTKGTPIPAPIQTPGKGQLPAHLMPTPSTPMPPARKQWFDKVADALLGDDEPSTTGSASRYALICQKCFTHNGLVKESVWEDAQYICPKCGHFNPSARSIRNGTVPTSPFSAFPASAYPVSSTVTPVRGPMSGVPVTPVQGPAAVGASGAPAGLAVPVPMERSRSNGKGKKGKKGRSSENTSEAESGEMEVDT